MIPIRYFINDHQETTILQRSLPACRVRLPWRPAPVVCRIEKDRIPQLLHLRPILDGLRGALPATPLGEQSSGASDYRNIDHFALKYTSTLTRGQGLVVGGDHARGAIDLLR